MSWANLLRECKQRGIKYEATKRVKGCASRGCFVGIKPFVDDDDDVDDVDGV